MSEGDDFKKIRVLVIGSKAVGKTSFIDVFANKPTTTSTTETTSGKPKQQLLSNFLKSENAGIISIPQPPMFPFCCFPCCCQSRITIHIDITELTIGSALNSSETTIEMLQEGERGEIVTSTDAFLVLYSVEDPESLEIATTLLKLLETTREPMKLNAVLVATKCGTRAMKQKSSSEAMLISRGNQLSKSFHIPHVLTRAEGDNFVENQNVKIQECFKIAALQTLQQQRVF